MASGLVDAIKRTSMEAVYNAQMCDLRYGTVVSVEPLKVQVTNQFTIPSSLLVVPQHLTDYELDITIDWNTIAVSDHQHEFNGTTESASGGSGDSSFASHEHEFSGTVEADGEHRHRISGRKTMLVHGALQIGDKVALLRKQGGQSYYILDRIRGD